MPGTMRQMPLGGNAMNTQRFVDLCAGIGGSRAGLEAAGWACELALDLDIHAVSVHRAVFGNCELGDVRELRPTSIPAHDVLFCGIPAGPVRIQIEGWDQHQGSNVFDGLTAVVLATGAKGVLLEGGYRFLEAQCGFAMARMVRLLTSIGYQVEWLVVNASWFGVPQTRPRVVIFGRQVEHGHVEGRISERALKSYAVEESLASRVTRGMVHQLSHLEIGSIERTLETVKPRIGRARPQSCRPFGSAGVAVGDRYVSVRISVRKPRPRWTLGDICLPGCQQKVRPRSVRYYARQGVTRPRLRAGHHAHCVGPKMSAAPLFAIPSEAMSDPAVDEAVQKHTNWRRYEGNMLVCRLTPERAVLLFGPLSEAFSEALSESKAGITRKYRMIGDMAAPFALRAAARECGRLLDRRPCPLSTV